MISTERIVVALRRKLSRITLLIRLRSTAREALLRLIANPKRGCCRTLVLAVSVKARQRIRFPVANTFRNSAGFSNLFDFWNLRSELGKTPA